MTTTMTKVQEAEAAVGKAEWTVMMTTKMAMEGMEVMRILLL